MTPHNGFSSPYLRVDDVQVETLDRDQLALFEALNALAPNTQRSYASGFRRHLEGREYRAANLSAFKYRNRCIRWGQQLNTLHANPEVAAYYRDRLQDDIEHEDIIDDVNYLGEVVYYRPATTQGRRRHRLKKLKREFDQTILAFSRDACRVDLHQGLVVLVLTGCRPCELSSLKTWNHAEGLGLTFSNAKQTHRNSTFLTRSFIVKASDGPYVEYVKALQAWAATQEKNPFSHIKAQDMTNLCQRLSAKLWKGKPPVNPSCFRCQLIADLKKDGWAREDIAALVGHVALKSASRYGTSNQGRRGMRSQLQLLAREREIESPEAPRG